MPTLNWIGKEAVVTHHKEVPFRLLEPVAELSCSPLPEEDVATSKNVSWGEERTPTTSAGMLGFLSSPQPTLLQAPPTEEGVRAETTGNLIVQGDNLHALKALLPRYAGQVKCIYIDPPYNTGNEGWVYNDNVNSPEIRRWLGEVVGKEGETLDRHDRWLCMMYPRLVLLRRFLREDGAIFVSIDDNEVATLRLLMDEVFGKRNFVETIIWEKNYAPKASARHFSEAHDYVVVYAFHADKWTRNLVPRSDKQDKLYKNPDHDPRGNWRPNNMAARNYYSKGTYPINCPSGRVIPGPPKGSYWRVSEEKLRELDQDGRIWWGTDGNNVPAPKIFLSEVKQGVVPMSLWPYSEVGHTQEGKRELLDLVDFGNSDDVFITPKPTRLIQRILQIATDKDSLVLDSFAGSGTTGHAVLKQNADDGGSRRFILVEMDENIARNVTAERVKRVCTGYSNAKEMEVPGLGGGFQFCRLSTEPLFTAEGQIRADVTFAQLAEFVWFAETGSGLPSRRVNAVDLHTMPDFPAPSPSGGRPGWGQSKSVSATLSNSPPPVLPRGGRDPITDNSVNSTALSSAMGGLTGNAAWPNSTALSPLLGIHEGRAIYLLYNGILKDKSVAGGNVLTGPVYDLLPKFDGPKVIYAAACRMGARLARENILFKQTPYALEV